MSNLVHFLFVGIYSKTFSLINTVLLMFFADTAAMSDKKCDFLGFSGRLAEVLAVADVHTLHALLIIDRGLCIEVFCRAADAICTFVNYLHSVSQI